MMKKQFWLTIVTLGLFLLALPLIANAEIVDSGTCGENLTWTLDEEGVLTISGTGAMTYDNHLSPPWSNYSNIISIVILPDGLMSIGEYAFSSCSNLTSITIPNSVRDIGTQAFSNCDALERITLPLELTTIQEATFYGCDCLTNIEIQEKVTVINRAAFGDCNSLTNIIIPDSVNWIGDSAFYQCHNLTSVSFPSQLTSIEPSLFYQCGNLRDITPPNSIISIGASAFEGCGSIEKIIIPDNVTYIGCAAFDGCGKLKTINLPKELTSINDQVFRSCSSLQDVQIPNTVTRIGKQAFNGCSNLVNIDIPTSVTIIDDMAFANCNFLKITIPQNVSYIGIGAFLSSLEDVVFTADENQQITFGSGDIIFFPGVTIYCHMYSAPASKFLGDYTIIYLEDINIDTIRSITLPHDFRMEYGDSIHLYPYVFPNDGQQIVWSTSDSSIVEISDDNNIIVLSAGTATITATIGTVSSTVNIEVYFPATSFSLSASELWVLATESVKLSVSSFVPQDASAIITWNSSDESKAKVDDDGNVITIKPGDVIISATTEKGLIQKCILHLSYPVTDISFSQPICYCALNKDVQLQANVTMRSQSCINHLITFTSSDETIATVDETGLVHGLSHGNVTITATAGSGVSATTEIEVHGPLTSHAKVDATCTETGTEAYWECSVCGDLFSDAEAKNKIDAPIVIAAKGHDWNNADYSWAEDNSTVTATLTCKNDASHIETETATVTSKITSPTETTEGTVTYISAEFSNVRFTVQTKDVRIPALSSMSVIHLPGMLTTIEDEAFENLACDAIIIPNSCTSIGNYAFRNCRNLKYIKVPAGVEIPSNAFEGCENVVIDRNAE